MNKNIQIATFAAGCFWGVEEAFHHLPGVLETEVGYSGGHTENPNYEQVSSGTTGHAESVRLKYDPEKIQYEKLLEIFWDSHDPTTPNQQGPDIGSQYRSIIFYHDNDQQRLALESKEKLDASGKYETPIVTEIIPAAPLYRAEEYHQQYFHKTGRRTCGA
jgi:peptide-methionine (S)-S-oxide reductase